MSIKILQATTPEQLAAIRHLFTQYRDGMSGDLCFQGFNEELATLPGVFAAPGGCLLLAYHNNTALGCVAARPYSPGQTLSPTWEMKRLFVAPEARKSGIAHCLMDSLISKAKEQNIKTIYLETLVELAPAIRLYRKYGFQQRPHNTPDIVAMQRDL